MAQQQKRTSEAYKERMEQVRVAIVHHWFVTRGGGERVAECIASLFPEAPIFTLMMEEAGIPAGLRNRMFHTSFLQKIPLARKFHRHTMPLYPAATESLDLRGFDLILSSDSGPVKGVRIDPGATHICYCHSPMRYLYDGFEAYRAQMGGLTRAIFSSTAARVRLWDMKAAEGVTHFIANSNYVADRIRRFYGRESTVIHPPIDVHRAQLSDIPGDHYLCAGRLVGYKRTDLLMEACVRLGRTLRIVGGGPELQHLRKAAAKSDLVTFLGEAQTDLLWREYSQCRALLFAADEDFGMVPLEAQACGRPVIAYGKGGSLETVRGTGPTPTGVFYQAQTVESITDGILSFEAAQRSGLFQSAAIQQWANTFAVPFFLQNYRDFILDNVPDAVTAMVP
jgi:glycosyltransferase involved in cell wall biosynthesis